MESTEQERLVSCTNHLPTMDHHLWLVGSDQYTRPLATALLQVQWNSFPEETSSTACIDDLAIEALRQSRNSTTSRRIPKRHVHLVESLSSLKNEPPMDHIVLVVPITCSPNFLDQIWKHSMVQPNLECIQRQDTWRQRVTIVAAIVQHDLGGLQSNDGVELPMDGRQVKPHIGILVCHVDRLQSRNTVARILWKKCALAKRADPSCSASPLVFRTSR